MSRDIIVHPAVRLNELGIVLPRPPDPSGNFVTYVREGSLVFLSGQGPRYPDGRLSTGKVGDGVTLEEAYQDARMTGINLISVMQAAVGDLGNVKRIVKVFGMVNAAADFQNHPAVINGCSDFFVDVFGPAGRHARSAVGMGSLPKNITVEIEAVIATE